MKPSLVVAAVAGVCLLVLSNNANAFAPPQQLQRQTTTTTRTTTTDSRHSLLALEAEKGAKRKLALKTAKRVLGTLATIAGATAAAPGVASAAAKVAPKAKQIQDVKDLSQAIKELLENGPLLQTIGTFVGGGVTALVLSNLLSPADESICETKIGAVFPGALKNKDLVDKVSRNLEKYGFGRSTLLVTSLCADEVNRFLEEDFSSVYGDNYSMGGLAGFPFAGASAFNAMASHIPDGGSCLLVFGPHVGVDSTGAVGTVERRGRAKGGPCCGSAVAAASYATAVSSGKIEKASPLEVATDAQQNYVGNMLLPYAPRLEKATDRMVELPYAMYDAQKKMMGDIIKAGAANVAGKIAVLGGIQINTPEGESDYFKPMSFEVYDNTGKLLEDLSPKL